MNEKDLSKIINPISRFVQISVANCSSGQTIFSSSDQIQADIARQLTRIADAQERLKAAEMLLCRIDKTNLTSCETKEDFLHIDVSQRLMREIHRFCETVSGETFTTAMRIHNQDYDPSPPDDGLTEVDQAYRKRMSATKTDDALVEAVKLTLFGDVDAWIKYADSNDIEREKLKSDYALTAEFAEDARYVYPARDKLKRLILEHALKAAHKKAVR